MYTKLINGITLYIHGVLTEWPNALLHHHIHHSHSVLQNHSTFCQNGWRIIDQQKQKIHSHMHISTTKNKPKQYLRNQHNYLNGFSNAVPMQMQCIKKTTVASFIMSSVCSGSAYFRDVCIPVANICQTSFRLNMEMVVRRTRTWSPELSVTLPFLSLLPLNIHFLLLGNGPSLEIAGFCIYIFDF